MQHGFKAVASELIRETPGLPAKEYAAIALERELCGSDSKDPLQSLGSTLAKEFREGRMPGIRVEKVGGVLCYFPNDPSSPAEPWSTPDVRIEVRLPGDVASDVHALVEVGRCPSPSDAVVWLAREGTRAQRPTLDRIHGILDEIRRLKQSVQDVR